MSKFIYTLLFFFITHSSFSNEWELLLTSKSIDWKSIELTISSDNKEQFLENVFQIDFFKNINDSALVKKSNFHFLHLDGDNLVDIIYSGFGGSEGVSLLFLKNTPKGFEVVLNFFGELQAFHKTGNLIKFQLVNYPCCAGYITHIGDFIFNIQDGEIELIRNVAFLEETMIPESLPINKDFETSKALNRLRSDPSLNNNLYDKDSRLFEAVGNIVAEFEKGTRGVALAETYDRTGQVMYFVIISKDAKINHSLFYGGPNDDQPFEYAGWMSGQFIKFHNL